MHNDIFMEIHNKNVYLPDTKRFENAYIHSLEDYDKLYSESILHSTEFWEQQARELLHWHHDFQMVSDCDFTEGLVSWFLGGKINASENCIDRHLKERGEQVAIIWEADEPGQEQRITYRELHREVSRLANVLRHNGIRKGDREGEVFACVADIGWITGHPA